MPLLRPSLLLPQAVTSWCFDRDPLIRGKPALLLYTFLARTRRRDFVKWSIRARRGDGVVEMSNALRVYAARPEHELYPQSIESETALISSSLPTFLRGVEGLSYENFLSETSFLIIRTRSNANGTGALFFLFLFLSALGFFFSRLLLNWPFATLSSFACGEYSV
jgi:hypothetical protein